ncbi:MAG: transglutaminase domain-containing protein [Candidatus Woesearchaeota archaeon]
MNYLQKIWLEYEKGELKEKPPSPKKEIKKTGFKDIDTLEEKIQKITTYKSDDAIKQIKEYTTHLPINTLQKIEREITELEQIIIEKQEPTIEEHAIRIIKTSRELDKKITNTINELYAEFTKNNTLLDQTTNIEELTKIRQETNKQYEQIILHYDLSQKRKTNQTHEKKLQLITNYGTKQEKINNIDNEIKKIKQKYETYSTKKEHLKDLKKTLKTIKKTIGSDLIDEAKKLKYLEGEHKLKQLRENIKDFIINPYAIINKINETKVKEETLKKYAQINPKENLQTLHDNLNKINEYDKAKEIQNIIYDQKIKKEIEQNLAQITKQIENINNAKYTTKQINELKQINLAEKKYALKTKHFTNSLDNYAQKTEELTSARDEKIKQIHEHLKQKSITDMPQNKITYITSDEKQQDIKEYIYANNEKIKKIAQTIKGKNDDETIQNATNWLNKNIELIQKHQDSQDWLYPQDVLKQKKATEAEKTNTLISIIRCAEIPSYKIKAAYGKKNEETKLWPIYLREDDEWVSLDVSGDDKTTLHEKKPTKHEPKTTIDAKYNDEHTWAREEKQIKPENQPQKAFSLPAYIEGLGIPKNQKYISVMYYACTRTDMNWSARFEKINETLSQQDIANMPDREYLERITHGLNKAIQRPTLNFDVSGAKKTYNLITNKLNII